MAALRRIGSRAGRQVSPPRVGWFGAELRPTAMPEAPLGMVSACLWDLRALCEQQLRALTDAQRLTDEYRTFPHSRSLLKRRLVADNDASEEELKKIDAEMRAVVTDAAEFAQSDPEPDPAELWTDVYKTA